MTHLSLAATLFVAAPGLGCSSEIEPGDDAKFDTVTEAVWGAQDDESTLEANVVVALGGGGCTGRLISPRIVLTAAHCVMDGARVTVQFGNDRAAFSISVGSERVITHPDYNRVTSSRELPAEGGPF